MTMTIKAFDSNFKGFRGREQVGICLYNRQSKKKMLLQVLNWNK